MAVAIAIVAVAALVIGVIIASQMQPPGGVDMSPATLDSFQITKAQEGHCVPFVTGTVRQTGNILWYGNLTTVEETQEVGGKGSSSEDVIIGYKYYLDMWQAVCLGEAEVLSVYINDKPKSLSDLGNYTQNDGWNDTFYPTQPGAYANKLRGVCHIFLDQYYMGMNVTAAPTMHWIVKSESRAPLTHANLPGGTNPAAVIYDLLVQGGAIYDNFNFTEFQAAATYFKNKGYALNMTFSQQKEVREHINAVLNYIDAGFDVDSEGKFILRPFDPQDASEFTVDKDDFIKFQFTRRAWKDTYNDFRANYTDADQAYTVRTMRTKNPANKRMVGYTRQKTVDLTAFTDPLVVSARLWEIMQRMSYPEAQIGITLPFKYASWPIGTVFTVNHEDYGIENFEFRIINKDVGEIDSQEIKIVAIQMVEKLADDNYTSPGGGQWVPPDYTPVALVKQKVFELPYNIDTLRDKAYLLLAAREGIETSYIVMTSVTGSDYETYSQHIQWSQHGILDEKYEDIDETYAIDDEVGILYTPYREDPEFSSISRADLFTTSRVCIIGNEMMAFQTVTPEGPNSIRLGGIIRGIMNTPIEDHANGSQIWITKVSDNILRGVTANDFYVKLLPSLSGETVDPGDADAIHVQPVSKARKPNPATVIVAVRTGSTIVLEWYPTSQAYTGAGATPSDDQQDQDPYLFAGDFHLVNTDSTDVIVNDTNYTDTEATSTTYTLRHRFDGVESDSITVVVPSGDGTYIGPTGLY